jgi:hypothetical protein
MALSEYLQPLPPGTSHPSSTRQAVQRPVDRDRDLEWAVKTSIQLLQEIELCKKARSILSRKRSNVENKRSYQSTDPRPKCPMKQASIVCHATWTRSYAEDNKMPEMRGKSIGASVSGTHLAAWCDSWRDVCCWGLGREIHRPAAYQSLRAVPDNKSRLGANQVYDGCHPLLISELVGAVLLEEDQGREDIGS